MGGIVGRTRRSDDLLYRAEEEKVDHGEKKINYKEDRAIAWLEKGAQPSDAVRRILVRDGVFEKVKPE